MHAVSGLFSGGAIYAVIFFSISCLSSKLFIQNVTWIFKNDDNPKCIYLTTTF